MGQAYSTGRLYFVASVLALAMPAFGHATEIETPPVLSATEVLSGVPLQTEFYTINEAVPTDGFMATYSITSPHGEFEASGPGMLETRLNEIRALAALDRIEDDEQFAKAAEDTAKDTVSNLRRIVEQPQETLEGVPKGVGRFFKRTSRTIVTGVQKLKDVQAGHMPGVESGDASNLPGGAPAHTGGSVSLTDSILNTSGDVAVNVLGFDKQRRHLAKELAVDPYTTNRVLAEKLDEVTWAAFAGGLGVNVLTSLVPGGFILSTSSRLSDWVWDTAPGDLRVEIEGALRSMDVEQPVIDRFLRHSFYTMSMQAVLVAALDDMDGVVDRNEIMPLVLSAGSEGQARFLVQTVDMLRKYHAKVQPLAALSVQGTVIGITATDQPVVMGPVDHMSWTPTLDRFAANLGTRFPAKPAMFSTGTLSASANEALTEKGWDLKDASVLGTLGYPVQ